MRLTIYQQIHRVIPPAEQQCYSFLNTFNGGPLVPLKELFILNLVGSLLIIDEAEYNGDMKLGILLSICIDLGFLNAMVAMGMARRGDEVVFHYELCL